MALSPEAVEWVERAESDVRVVRKLRDAEDRIVVAFRCQQAIEKYPKAFLVEARVSFPRTHDLADLVERCGAIEPSILRWTRAAAQLQPFAVNVRYPGSSPSIETVHAAVVIMEEIRAFLRVLLGLPADPPSAAGGTRDGAV